MRNFSRKSLFLALILLLLISPILSIPRSVKAEESIALLPYDASYTLESVKIKKITVTISASYALDTNGRLWAVGDGQSSKYVFGAFNRHTYLDFFDGKPIKDIQAGLYALIVLLEDGTVWSHDNNNPYVNSFVQWTHLQNIASISVNYNNSYAINVDGTVWNFSETDPTQLQKMQDINGLELSQLYDNYFVKKDGTVWRILHDASPVQFMGLANIKKIFEGNFGLTTYAITNDGAVWGWGAKRMGGINLDYLSDDQEKSKVPVLIEGLDHVTDITGGGQHFTVTKEDGSVWAWGLNQWNQLGDGTKNNSALPVRVENLNKVEQVFGNRTSNENFALFSDGTVKAWGANEGCVTNVECKRASIDIPAIINFDPPVEPLENAKTRFSIQYNGAYGNSFSREAHDENGNIVIVGARKLLLSDDYGQKWQERPLPVNSDRIQMNYVNDRFYLWTYNSASTFYWSKNGEDWTEGILEQNLEEQEGKPLWIENIVWLNNQYVMLADLESHLKTFIYVSSDGLTWKKLSTIGDGINQIVWNGKGYTALGGGLRFNGTPTQRNQFADPQHPGNFYEMIVHTSDDLINWTRQSGGEEFVLKPGWNTLPYKYYSFRLLEIEKNGTIILYDSDNRYLVSKDGITFQIQKLNMEPEILKELGGDRSEIFWNGKQYLIYVGLWRDEGLVLVSNDKVNWKKQKISNIPLAMIVIKSGKNFIGFRSNGLLASSQDGLNWKIKQSYPEQFMKQIIKINGSYLIIGSKQVYSVPVVLKSKDGTAWTEALSADPLNTNTNGLLSIAWSGKGFVAVGGNEAWVSKDGDNWKKSSTLASGSNLKKIIWTGNQFLALSDQYDKLGVLYKTIVYVSPDGVKWKNIWDKNVLIDAAAHDGTVVMVGTKNNQALILESTSLKEWKTQTFTLGKDNTKWGSDDNTSFTGGYSHTFENVQWVKDSFIIMSDHIYSSKDGIHWSNAKSGYSTFLQGRDNQSMLANGEIIWTGKDYRYIHNNVLGVSIDLMSWKFYDLAESSGGFGNMVWTGTDLLAVGGEGSIIRITDR